MNFPFLISDIIERIVPGGIFLFVAVFLLGFERIGLLADKELLGALAFFGFSYSFGVLFNVCSNKLTFLETRYFIPEPADYGDVLAREFEVRFREKFSTGSWRFCYGVVQKESLAVNTALFGGMAVFCRSMAVCCLFIALTVLFAPLGTRVEFAFGAVYLGSVILFASLLGGFVFTMGARTYGKSFALSIYDSFLTYSLLTPNPRKS